VSLDHIERVLREAGHEVVCGGRDDRLVVATCTEEAKVLKEAVVRIFGFHHTVVHTVRLAAFPLKPTGKIDYAALEAMA